MILAIKHMVCPRCVAAVQKTLDDLAIPYSQVRLGEVDVPNPIPSPVLERLVQNLASQGFELIADPKARQIEAIKHTIISLARNPELKPAWQNLSDYLAQQLETDYTSLAALFRSVEGLTLEKYFIAQRIEFAKELLVYGEENLTDIAFRLGYSSSQHLSNQFKSVTGLTPSQFRHDHQGRRIPLDQVAQASKRS